MEKSSLRSAMTHATGEGLCNDVFVYALPLLKGCVPIQFMLRQILGICLAAMMSVGNSCTTARPAPKSVQKPELAAADLALLHEFLRAAYLPKSTRYSIRVDPDDESFPGMPKQKFRAELSNRLSLLLRKEGNIVISAYSVSNTAPYGSSELRGIFLRRTGEIVFSITDGSSVSHLAARISRWDKGASITIDSQDHFVISTGSRLFLFKHSSLPIP